MERVWILAEQHDGVASAATLELATAASALAPLVEAWGWGPGLAETAATLGAHGVSRLYDVGDLGGSLPAPRLAGTMAATTSGLPDAVLLTSTYDGRDTAARLSVLLDRPLLANVVGLRLDDEGRLEAEHAPSAGNEVVRSRLTGDPPAIVLVRPRSFEPSAAGGRPAAVEAIESVDVGERDRATVVGRHLEERFGPSLEDAAVVVAGGRGLGGAEHFVLVERLAALLKGAPGASRAVVDAGWAPYALQVGQTGKIVNPDVYVALGISGATQHLVGMRASRHILAIDKDEQAPMVRIAELGVVGDLRDLLPRLIAALKARG